MGPAAEELVGECDDGVGRKLVGEAGLGLRWPDFRGGDLSRWAGVGGVYEDYGFGAAYRFGEFRGKLMSAEDFDIKSGRFPFQRGSGAPCHAIVRAHRVSVGDDQ